MNNTRIAHFHLPGLYEFYEFYKVVLPVFYEHRDWFFDNVEISSIYGAPLGSLWSGGRVGFGDNNTKAVLSLMDKYSISARLTFSNSLLAPEHLKDRICSDTCKAFAHTSVQSGVIVHSDLLLDYLKESYPNFYFVSSTTKVITDFNEFIEELDRPEFNYVVPDFRFNPRLDELKSLSLGQKDKVEFLCNECCSFTCSDRKTCYEIVSRKVLGEDVEHICKNDDGRGYTFSKAMTNHGFISNDAVFNTYLPMGFSNFKIEGRSLGSAIILEFLLYYLAKPQYHINIREAIYLDATLDLF